LQHNRQKAQQFVLNPHTKVLYTPAGSQTAETVQFLCKSTRAPEGSTDDELYRIYHYDNSNSLVERYVAKSTLKPKPMQMSNQACLQLSIEACLVGGAPEVRKR
jgi:hypothetical protein